MTACRRHEKLKTTNTKVRFDPQSIGLLSNCYISCLRNVADLRQVVIDGAAKPIWPKFMTVATMTIGLVTILWSTGAGADLMKRIAAPMVGGLATSFLMELLMYPILYMIWRRREISLEVAPHSDFAEHNSRSEVYV